MQTRQGSAEIYNDIVDGFVKLEFEFCLISSCYENKLWHAENKEIFIETHSVPFKNEDTPLNKYQTFELTFKTVIGVLLTYQCFVLYIDDSDINEMLFHLKYYAKGNVFMFKNKEDLEIGLTVIKQRNPNLKEDQTTSNIEYEKNLSALKVTNINTTEADLLCYVLEKKAERAERSSTSYTINPDLSITTNPLYQQRSNKTTSNNKRKREEEVPVVIDESKRVSEEEIIKQFNSDPNAIASPQSNPSAKKAKKKKFSCEVCKDPLCTGNPPPKKVKVSQGAGVFRSNKAAFEKWHKDHKK